MVDCANCIEKCPQAAAANEIAKGRMFAEREFINLINKIENGTLVEVVRCRECIYYKDAKANIITEHDRVCTYASNHHFYREPDEFCSHGKRKGGDE